MALAYAQYPGNGSNRNFNVTFPYIARDHLEVKVNGTKVSFVWLTATTIQLTAAPPKNSIVDVRRKTPRDRLLVDFQDASTLVETDLDLSALQVFYLAQEAFDLGEASLGVTEDGSFSALNRRISNVLEPVLPQDVATRNFVETGLTSQLNLATQRANDAAAARAGALASETASASSASASASARDVSTQKATDAATSASNALAYRNTASQKATDASSNAADSLASKNAATQKAAEAAASATAAKASETTANQKAEQAFASEANALASRNTSSTKASEAAASEANALAYRNMANQKAVEAAASAADALVSKNTATQKASDIVASAAAAKTSENAAAASATAAARSAQDAAKFDPSSYYMMSEVDAKLAVKLSLSGGSMSGRLVLPASTTAGAPLQLPHGAAPTTPVNGEVWTTTGGLFCRINGATRTSWDSSNLQQMPGAEAQAGTATTVRTISASVMASAISSQTATKVDKATDKATAADITAGTENKFPDAKAVKDAIATNAPSPFTGAYTQVFLAINTPRQNTTGKPLYVAIVTQGNGSSVPQAVLLVGTPAGGYVQVARGNPPAPANFFTLSMIVAPGEYYQYNHNNVSIGAVTIWEKS